MTYKFEAPASARPREIEWPPGSGRTASYTHGELLIMRKVKEAMLGGAHAPRCEHAADPFSNPEPKRCYLCSLVAELTSLHDLKVEFGINIANEDVADEQAEEKPAATQLAMHRPEFDAEATQQAASEGMTQALRAERTGKWKRHATGWLNGADAGSEFTADDLVGDVGVPDLPGEVERANNVVGAWFAQQSRQGHIVFSGRFRPSTRPESHGNMQRVWKKA